MRRETLHPLDLRRLFGCSFELCHPDERERFNVRYEQAMDAFKKREIARQEVQPFQFRRQAD